MGKESKFLLTRMITTSTTGGHPAPYDKPCISRKNGVIRNEALAKSMH